MADCVHRQRVRASRYSGKTRSKGTGEGRAKHITRGSANFLAGADSGGAALAKQVCVIWPSADRMHPNSEPAVQNGPGALRSSVPLIPMNYLGDRLTFDLDEIVLRPANRDHDPELDLPGNSQQLA